MATDISLKQKEAKTIAFTISGTFSLAAATYQFGVKKHKSVSAYSIKKVNADFDVSEIDDRKVKVSLSTSDLDLDSGNYKSELQITLSADNIDKSVDIPFEIIESVNK